MPSDPSPLTPGHPSPPLRLGLIADPQYADLPPDLALNRHFAASLAKLSAAVDTFNGRDLDAVVVVGDLIDRDSIHFAPALKVLERLSAPLILLPGNHDFAVADPDKARVHSILSMPAPYYDVVIRGVRLIITDGCEISTFAPPPGDPRAALAEDWLARLVAAGAIHAKPWNAGMGEAQIAWLEARLALASREGQPALVFGHYPLHPPGDHALWNGAAVAEVIAASPAARAHINGHDHRGGFGRLGNTAFLTLKGMVDGAEDTAYAILTLAADRLEIEGFGREDSRVIAALDDRPPAGGAAPDD